MYDYEYANLLQGYNNLRRFLLEEKPHIKEYNKIRKMHSEIINSMAKFYYNGKNTTVRIHNCNFNLNTQLGAQGLYDILIYKTVPDLSCITEEFIQSNRYKKPEKIELLHSMLNTNIGLFEVTNTDIDEGYAYIKEIFTGKEYRIIDIGLSGQQNYSDIYLYTRIITHNGISFGSGLNFVFKKTDDFIKNHIQYHKKNYTPDRELIRFMELYNYLYNNPGKDRVVVT